MGRECSTHGIEEECILDFGGKARMKETTRKTKTRRRQPTARVLSVARGNIFNGTLSEFKYSIYSHKKLNC
jgi:hypothetical protein